MTNTKSVHWSFWLIGVLALLWHLPGVPSLFLHFDPKMVESMPEVHGKIIETRPAWLSWFCSLAILSGTLACISLLLRKRVAINLFVVSLTALLIQALGHLPLVGTVIIDPMTIIMMLILPPIVSGFLTWYSMQVKKKAWIS